MQKFKFEIIIFSLVFTIYVISLFILFFDFSGYFKNYFLMFKFDFSRFLPDLEHEIILTSVFYSFFLLFVPFLFYIITYIKSLFFFNHYTSYLFFPHKYKRYMKQLQAQVFDEENLDIDVDVSANFYHGDLIIYNYPLIFLMVLPCFLICLIYYDALDWDDLWMEDEEETFLEQLDEDYGSFQSSLFDEYIFKHPFIEMDTYVYERSEKFIEELQEESLEYVMEDLDLEEEVDYLDFLESLAQTITNLIFNRLPIFLPTSMLNFLKFQNTELAIKNLLIFFFYFPFLIFVIFRHFFYLLKRIIKRKTD